MRHTWMRKTLLFLMTAVVLSACEKPEYSSDEPLEAELETNLYIASEGNMLYALNPANGGTRWTFYEGRGITYEPLALGNSVFVPSTSNVLRLNAITGKVIDSFPDMQDDNIFTTKITGALAGEGNYIYITFDMITGGQTTTRTFKYDYTKTGEPIKIPENWQILLDEVAGTPTTIPTSPIIYGNNILLPISDRIRLNSTADPNAYVYEIPTACPHNPTTDGVHLYNVNGNTLTAYNYEDGTTLWTYVAPEVINTSPIQYGGNIIFGCEDNKVYCIDSIAQQPRWVFKTDERVYSSPYAYDQTVYFGSNDHYFYAVNIEDGSLKWKYRTGALIKSSPVAYEGTVYVGSYDQNMYAFDTSGALKWRFQTNGLIKNSPAIYDPMKSGQKQIYSAVSGLSSQ